MPSVLAHPLVAIAARPWFGRRSLPLSVLLAGVVLSILPDADVIGLRLGVPYDSMFGHRGFSHSIAFALLGSLLTGALFLRAGVRLVVSVPFFFLCLVSHGILDAFTNGGHGVAFFAPFSDERYFWPWRPIEVSPLSIRRFLDGRALPVLANELLWVGLPCLLLFGLGRALRRS